MGMKDFLNYVVWYGDVVPPDIVSIVRRSLYSRNKTLAEQGLAPCWGWHETFQAGHW